MQPDTHPDNRALRGWATAAIAALAVAGLYAPVLALSRLPGIETVISWPLHAFEKGIITHVVFSIVVWCLAMFGALMAINGASRQNRMPEQFSLVLLAAAFVLLLVPSLMDRGQPSLNNYVPVIIDPLYYAGILALFLGLAIPSVRLLLDRAAPGTSFLSLPLKASALAYLAAMVAFGHSAALLGDRPLSESYNEDLFWAGGHILQFVNAGLMLAGALALSKAREDSRMVRIAFQILSGGAVLSLLLFALTDMADGTQRIGFSDLKYLLAVPAILVAADLFQRRRHWLKADFPTTVIIAAVVTFAVGGIFGFFVDGADTRTPAHYHGVLGGVNIIFFGLFFTEILPRVNRAVVIGKKAYALIGLYAAGQTLQCVGLFMAGGYGTPRKTAGAAQGLEALGAVLGMALNGIGALIAVIGGIMFVVIVGKALLKKTPERTELSG